MTHLWRTPDIGGRITKKNGINSFTRVWPGSEPITAYPEETPKSGYFRIGDDPTGTQQTVAIHAWRVHRCVRCILGVEELQQGAIGNFVSGVAAGFDIADGKIA
jgi:hypothetical protein